MKSIRTSVSTAAIKQQEQKPDEVKRGRMGGEGLMIVHVDKCFENFYCRGHTSKQLEILA